jgi:hypothetical protein
MKATWTASCAVIALGDSGWVVTLDATPRVLYRREWMLSSGVRCRQQSYYLPSALGEQMYVDELAHFLNCAKAGTPTRIPFTEGVRVLDVCGQVMP